MTALISPALGHRLGLMPIRHPGAAAAATLMVIGLSSATLGFAVAALLIAAAIGVSGLADRRLPVLLALLFLPSLTLFHPLVLTRVGESALDFRLLLTGGLVLAVAPWAFLGLTRRNTVGWLLLAFVALLGVMTLLNDVAPLRALPVVARWAVYALVYIAAWSWLRDRRDPWLVVACAIAGLAPAILSAAIQAALGQGLDQNDATRLSGIYGTSPVGLGLAMQLVALSLGAVLASIGLPWSGRWQVRPAYWLIVALFILAVMVLVGTATRLVFASFAVGLLFVLAMHGRYRSVPLVLLAVVAVLIAQPDLAGRFASTIEPLVARPSVVAPADPNEGSVRDSGEPSEAAPARSRTPAIPDASLRFRLYIWGTMLPEWMASPIVGRGTGSFSPIFEERTGIQRVAPHNDYLGFLVENGVVGLATYILLQVTVLLALARRTVMLTSWPRTLAVIALVNVVALDVLNMINNPVLFLDLQVAMWAIVAVAMAPLRAPGSGVPTPRSTVVAA